MGLADYAKWDVVIDREHSTGSRLTESHLDSLGLDTVLLSEWRNNASGRAFADRADSRGMCHMALTEAGTANGIFLASSDPFTTESATPSVEGGPGRLMLARFQLVTLLACYFPQLADKAPFFE